MCLRALTLFSLTVPLKINIERNSQIVILSETDVSATFTLVKQSVIYLSGK